MNEYSSTRPFCERKSTSCEFDKLPSKGALHCKVTFNFSGIITSLMTIGSMWIFGLKGGLRVLT